MVDFHLTISQKKRFFPDLSQKEIQLLESKMHPVQLVKGEILFEEESTDNEIFFIQKGKLEILKKGHRLALLKDGDFVGEIAAILENVPRTAGVRAIEPCFLFKLSLKDLKEVSKQHPNLYTKVIANLSKSVVKRLKLSSEAQISEINKRLVLAEMRISMGRFLIYLLSVVVSFFFILKILYSFQVGFEITSFFTIPLIVFFCIFVGLLIKHSPYPAREYGLTLRNWKKSLVESLLFTIPILVFILFVKWILLKTSPAFSDKSLFRITVLINQPISLLAWIAMTIGYVFSAPLQEVLARGCLQGMLEKFLVQKNRRFLAILFSNLIFSSLHFEFPIQIVVFVFFVGLFWGWLYSRHHTLIGVSISHFIIGLWGGLIVGYL